MTHPRVSRDWISNGLASISEREGDGAAGVHFGMVGECVPEVGRELDLALV